MRGPITACDINVCSCLATVKLIVVGSLISPGHRSFSPCACVYIRFVGTSKFQLGQVKFYSTCPTGQVDLKSKCHALI